MAIPAILQMLGAQNQATVSPQVAQIKQMIGAIRSAGNPQAILQQMMQQRNPQLMQAIEYVKQHGGDAKAACEALAKEKGISMQDLGL